MESIEHRDGEHKYAKCDWCGLVRLCEYTTDPYVREKMEELIWGWWCLRCLRERAEKAS